MKVAIVHDYIKEYGGAERVLEALHEIWPDAPIFTTVYLPNYLGPHRERFKGWKIRTSWFQNVPFKGKLISPLRILAPFLFNNMNFSRYDVVIVSQTGAYTPNLIKKGKAVQICYTHTPPRYLYGYATARDWKKNPTLKLIGTLMNHILRLVDYKSSENVDYFISNSENVRQRIQKFYRRDAKVVYPPVEIPDSSNEKKDNYFLAGGRIAGPKHIDLIIKAFKELKIPLKIYGRTFAGTHSLELMTQNSKIELLGEVSDAAKQELLRSAKGFVLASEDEDFGITPVEAMALGTPVIAYKSGGFLETVIDGKTGIFFDRLTVPSLKLAVLRYNKMRFDRTYIINHAKKFSKERFKKEMKEFVQKHARTSRS